MIRWILLSFTGIIRFAYQISKIIWDSFKLIGHLRSIQDSFDFGNIFPLKLLEDSLQILQFGLN